MDTSEEARESFTAWVEARQDRLLRTAYLLTGYVHRAEDLLQEALITVARRWSRLRAGHPDAGWSAPPARRSRQSLPPTC